MAIIRQVVDGKVVIPEEPKAPEQPAPMDSYQLPGVMDEEAVAQVLDVHDKMTLYDHELKTIVKWAQNEGYKNPDELKWIVRSLQTKLATPPLTEKWVTRVARYAYLQLEGNRLQKEKESLII